ncbi:hypothetical protein [Reichenbachiella sp. MALMAid0571]|uniref:hypothetical protein n=1 Tax=Reichenbachiella sp. MALMAid0571 TaxID=3143939 RepID=UPI0032DF90DF
MKKVILLFTLFISISFISAAQTKKGSWLVAAASDLSFLSGDETTTFNLSLSPGYFVVDNLAFGIGLEYSEVSYKGFGDTFKTDQSILGVFGRYYPGGKGILGVSYSHFSENQGVNILGLEGGYAFFFNDHVSIEPTLNYLNFSDSSYSDSFGLNISFGIYF